MPAKLSTPIFITRSNAVHAGKYTYSKAVYVNSYAKICITCPIHGDFWQIPYNHLNGFGCRICGNRYPKISNNEDFIEHARKIHIEKYDYSKVEYINGSTIICIICPEHGEFWQVPKSHLNGSGCRKCWYKRRNTNLEKNTKEPNFEKLKMICGEEYRIEGKYVDNKTSLKFIHYCGFEFMATPQVMFKRKKSRCRKCEDREIWTDKKIDKTLSLSNKNIQRMSKLEETFPFVSWECLVCHRVWETRVHATKNLGCSKCAGFLPLTDYEIFQKLKDSNRENELKKIGKGKGRNFIWKCLKPECSHEWAASPSNLFNHGSGCPNCKASKGERAIFNFLKKHNFLFKPQFRINECRYKNPLPFDFAVFNSNYNIKCLIEFDGIQHFKPIANIYFAKIISEEEAEFNFQQQKLKDFIKDEFCKNNEIPLLRIKYTEIKKIDKILKNYFGGFE